tara:strand:+ start:105 stop:908 length:804 start_codon:yes stop_codon:yes gene_type:complete
MTINFQKKLKPISDNNSRSILPNILTVIGVCIGLTSIKFALDERFDLSIIAIILAAIFDGLDGRIARLIKGTSKVGKELDSLSDAISFGVAPGFIMYFWYLNEMGKIGWVLSLVYIVCVALRLARFNVYSNTNTSWKDNFFEGVPSPAGGILVLLPLILDKSYIFELSEYRSELVTTMFIIIPLLMISKIPTYSLKKIIIPRKLTVFLLFGIGVFFALLLIYTFKVIFVSGLIYLLFIPVSIIHYKMLKNKYKNINDLDEEEQEDML